MECLRGLRVGSNTKNESVWQKKFVEAENWQIMLLGDGKVGLVRKLTEIGKIFEYRVWQNISENLRLTLRKGGWQNKITLK